MRSVIIFTLGVSINFGNFTTYVKKLHPEDSDLYLLEGVVKKVSLVLPLSTSESKTFLHWVIDAIEFEEDGMSDISGTTKASSLDFDVDMDDHMDNEDVGNNTIVFRDDGAEEDTEIMDVMVENV